MYKEPELKDLFLINQVAMIFQEDGDFNKTLRTAYNIDKEANGFYTLTYLECESGYLVAQLRSEGWMEIIPNTKPRNNHHHVLILEADGDSNMIIINVIANSPRGTEYVMIGLLSNTNERAIQYYIEPVFKEVTFIDVLDDNPQGIFDLQSGTYSGLMINKGTIGKKKPSRYPEWLSGFNQRRFIDDMGISLPVLKSELIQSSYDSNRYIQRLTTENAVIAIVLNGPNEIASKPPVVYIFICHREPKSIIDSFESAIKEVLTNDYEEFRYKLINKRIK